MVGIIVLLSIRKHMFSPYKEISKYVTQNEATLRMDCERYLEQKYVNQSDDDSSLQFSHSVTSNSL